MSTPTLPKAVVENLAEILNESAFDYSSAGDLRDALWHRDEDLFAATTGAERTKLAKNLLWERYPFEHDDDISPGAVVLEEKNNIDLSILAPGVGVLTLGDTIRFEANGSRGWGKSSRKEHTKRITRIGTRSVQANYLPTYSNTATTSLQARFRDIAEITERTSLDPYRDRLTETTDIDIPEAVNGWELEYARPYEWREDHIDNTMSGAIHEIKWTNNDGAEFVAKWRCGYRCWRLSAPRPGCVTDENTDRYLYEIDVPQTVIRTADLISLAVDGMQALSTADFQERYTMTPEDHPESPALPVALPEQIGPWEIHRKLDNRWEWVNQNPDSPWRNFEVELSATGTTTVYTDETRMESRFHDARENDGSTRSDSESEATTDFGSRYRDAFDANWQYAIAFMVQTSKNTVDESELPCPTPESTSFANLETGLDTDPFKKSPRESKPLTAY